MQTNMRSLVIKRLVNFKWLVEAVKTFPAVFKRKQRKYLLEKPYFNMPLDQQGDPLLANQSAAWLLQLKNSDTDDNTGAWLVDVVHDYNMQLEEWYDDKIRIVRVHRNKFLLLNFPPIYYSSEAPAKLYLVIKSNINHEGRSINLRPTGGDL